MVGKFLDTLKIAGFPEYEPFNRKFQRLYRENHMEPKFPVRDVPKFG